MNDNDPINLLEDLLVAERKLIDCLAQLPNDFQLADGVCASRDRVTDSYRTQISRVSNGIALEKALHEAIYTALLESVK